MPSFDAYRLVADLASGDAWRKRDATDVIVRLHPASAGDEFVLIAALDDTNPDVVHWLCVALRLLGPRCAPALPRLLALLHRDELFLRQATLLALATVAPHDPEARTAIFNAFGDPSPFIRRIALQAGLSLPDLTDDDFAAIAGMVTDPDAEVAQAATRAITPPASERRTHGRFVTRDRVSGAAFRPARAQLSAGSFSLTT